MMSLLNEKGRTETQLLLPKEDEWGGCFGVSSVISHEALTTLEETYGISGLWSSPLTRPDRYGLERVFGMLGVLSGLIDRSTQKSLFGDILNHKKTGGYTLTHYQNDREKGRLPHYPIIKVWNGR